MNARTEDELWSQSRRRLYRSLNEEMQGAFMPALRHKVSRRQAREVRGESFRPSPPPRHQDDAAKAPPSAEAPAAKATSEDTAWSETILTSPVRSPRKVFTAATGMLTPSRVTFQAAEGTKPGKSAAARSGRAVMTQKTKTSSRMWGNP